MSFNYIAQNLAATWTFSNGSSSGLISSGNFNYIITEPSLYITSTWSKSTGQAGDSVIVSSLVKHTVSSTTDAFDLYISFPQLSVFLNDTTGGLLLSSYAICTSDIL